MAKKNNNLSCDCNVLHEEQVNKAKTNMLSESMLVDMANFYKAVGDLTRMKIINALYNNKLCVCDISYMLNMTKSAVSHQLKYLKNAYLIDCTKQGKEVYYFLADNHVKDLFEISKQHILEMNNEKGC